MNRDSWSANLYLLNSALLYSHEIDSAFWKEWDLFGIPGGIQVFVVLNFLLLLVALFGFRQVLRGAPGGRWFSLLLGRQASLPLPSTLTSSWPGGRNLRCRLLWRCWG